MCGRFFIDARNREIDRLLEEMGPDSQLVKRGEVFPTDIAITFILNNGAVLPKAMSWGFPKYTGKGVVFNARRESVWEKPMFRYAMLHNRAIIPVSGFFEWQKLSDRKHKNKYYFSNANGKLLYLAAIWKRFDGENGSTPEHFTILTTSANESCIFCHDRMPVLIKETEFIPWLEGNAVDDILARAPFALSAAKTSAYT